MRRPRSRSAEDLDAVDVLLVDDDEEDVAADEVRMVLHELALEAMARRATWPGDPQPLLDADTTGDPSAPTGMARRIARRYRRRVVTGAVLAVAVATTTAVVDARETAARAAALAATPAVLAQPVSPPAEVWRVPGRIVSDQDDLLLVADGASLRAVDPASGETTWTASAEAGRAASSGDCFPVDEALLPDRAPVEDDGGPRGLVACAPGAPAGTSGAAAAAGDTTAGAGVVVIDSATGRTRTTVTADGSLLLAEPVGRDLLVVTARADGRVGITRWDPGAGTPRWESVSPLPTLAGGAADVVERRSDSLTVGGFAVDLATGEPLDAELESRQPHPYAEHTLPNGARATWAWRQEGASGRGRVWGGSSGRSYMLPGPPLRPRVTDGSDSRVLVVRTAAGERLRGLDLSSGRMRWTRPSTGASALRATALIDGVMLLDDGATVTALEVRSGDPVWHAPVAPLATDGALTDGQVVLLPTPADDGDVHLVARRLTDGAETWRTEVPSGTAALTVVDHHLIARTDDEVIGLG